VTPEYFETLGVRPVAGRVFVDADADGSPPVVIVNRRFVERFLPGRRAIGHRIRLVDPGPPQPWLTIVGVVPDLFLGGLRPDQRSGVYAPLAQKPRSSMRIVIRTRGEPAAFTPFVRAQVAALDSSLPIDRPLTMEQVLDGETWAVGLFGTLFAAFGVAALFLAAVGLYGVVAFSTSQRTHEIGIRIALGATVRDVVSLVMRQGLWQLGSGVTLGMALGLGFSRMIASWFFGLGPYDPVTVAIVVIVMLTTTVLACLTPARRAVRIDPATALREQ
jgi:putative ABC transport system permease protein